MFVVFFVVHVGIHLNDHAGDAATEVADGMSATGSGFDSTFPESILRGGDSPSH